MATENTNVHQESKEASLYSGGTPTATTLSRVNTSRSTGGAAYPRFHATGERRSDALDATRSGRSSAVFSRDDKLSEALEAFENLQLEKQNWFWNLGLLTFGMALLITGDFLYDFPSAPLTDNAFGTNDLTFTWKAIVAEYAIWYGLIVVILFVYTAAFITFDGSRWDHRCRFMFGAHDRARRLVVKYGGYLLVTVLLSVTLAFDIFLFYYPDSASRAYYQATQGLYN